MCAPAEFRLLEDGKMVGLPGSGPHVFVAGTWLVLALALLAPARAGDRGLQHAAPDSRRAGPPSEDRLQDWIARHALAIRSIDPTDEDDGDLEPLIGAIGSSRVVQLGEPSHGAGSSFAAKARLIKFLHRRMGFDVLAWESGFHELRYVQAAMRAGGDPMAAAQRGVLTIWSNAGEARPLFEHVKASQGTTRPLEMVGFDMQATAGGSDERFAADLRAFAAALPASRERRRIVALADRAVAAYQRLHRHRAARQRRRTEASETGLTGAALDEALHRWEREEGSIHRPTEADRDAFLGAIAELLTTVDAQRAVLGATHGAREVAFMERAIANMRGRGAATYGRERSGAPSGPDAVLVQSEEWNRRDALMADNLRWLIEEALPGRKVIVWAHNAHIMNAYFAADWRGVHAGPQPHGMKPAGVFLAEWLKDGLYTIAVTTYEGEDAWANGQRRGPVSPAADGSLESRLHKLGKPYLFLDLSAARGKDGHPMRTPQRMRVSGYGPPTSPYGSDLVPDPTAAFDAVFYIDRMAPATPLPPPD